MCGIVSYIGHQKAKQILLEGLHRLEYRGYDSAGIALLHDGQLHVFKKQGKVAALEEFVGTNTLDGTIGIGHTRWATHGEPSDVNAHPHLFATQRTCCIHNGIIENYATLKLEVEQKGHILVSQTDTEVLTRLIEQVQIDLSCSLTEAVRVALTRVEGSYAIVVLSQDEPDRLIAARKGSPLVIGVGEGGTEHWVASDATPIIQHTRDVVYLGDQQVAVITRDGLTITGIDASPVAPVVQRLDMELSAVEKGGYEHFMLKEIMEQPKSLEDCLRGRVSSSTGYVGLNGINKTLPALLSASRLIFVACGTSRHAALVGEYLIEGLARVSVEVEFASEFRYRDPVVGPGDVVVAMSQSGETADTLAAMQVAKEKGATVLAICNAVGSSVARLSDEGCYTQAGPEIGVASTKAFTTQLAVLSVLALMLAKHKKTLPPCELHALIADLERLPALMQEALLTATDAKALASQFLDCTSCLYLGRGLGYPVALEGALKLKEIAYVDANGYAAGELKHGPIALIVPGLPVVVVATQGNQNDKLASNVQEVRARGGRVLAVVTKGDERMRGLAEDVLEVPAVHPMLAPILAIVPLQLLSYYIALSRGCNVDQPRNLAKSVTVE